MGIRHSISSLTNESTSQIRAKDFDPKSAIENRFPPEGSKYTPPHRSVDIIWKDYCPFVFRVLREIFRVDLTDYLLSVYGNDALREISSPGKSGGLFYLTLDDRFMIKRVKKSEIKVLMKILPSYYKHICMFEKTLLTEFYGAYSYKQVGGMNAHFVVMNNLFYSKYPIHRQFDLKGSSYGRSCDGEIDETTTLKDLDLRYVFRLHPNWHKILMKQIDLDCEFLEAQSIMDYSLVIGVHFCDDNNTDNIMGNVDSYQSLKLSDGFKFPETDPFLSGGVPYKINYDINKKLELAYKSLQVDPTSISAVDPKLYKLPLKSEFRSLTT